MYAQDKNSKLKQLFLFVPVLLVVPFLVAFDTLVYFITKPSCLNCGNVIEFLKTASLTVFIMGGAGYKLGKKK